MPEPNKVIAATDLSQGMPLLENDTAKITAEIAKVDPATSGSPVTSAESGAGPDQRQRRHAAARRAQRRAGHGNGITGQLPGFAALAPSFKQTDATLANLPEPVLLRLPSDVLFDFDSAQLKPDADPLLSQAVALITKYPQADVHIDGYSDSFGKPDYNQTLSQQRAEAVQAGSSSASPQSELQLPLPGPRQQQLHRQPATGTIDQQQPNRRVEILIQAMKP